MITWLYSIFITFSAFSTSLVGFVHINKMLAELLIFMLLIIFSGVAIYCISNIIVKDSNHVVSPTEEQ